MGELFDSWLRKFEEDGEETVRMKVAAGVFSQTHKEAAEGWLKSKAVAREDQSRRDTLASQTEANDIASAARSAAERAADAALRSAAATEAASEAADRQAAAAQEANRLAREANRLAHRANTRAVIAIAISIVSIAATIAVAIVGLLHTE
jgi:hypothetical protein